MSESPGTPLERFSKDDEHAGNAADGGGRGAVCRAWCWELGAVALAMALFVTTIILLAHYDGKPPPELPKFLSLNSIISIFSATIHAMLLVAVAEAISQTRWLWFQKQRPLRHLEKFNDASRGVLGAFQLLFQRRKPNLALLGALIAITALAIDPFTQQAVDNKDCFTNNGHEATVAVAKQVSGADVVLSRHQNVSLSPAMKGVVVSGLLGHSRTLDDSFSCPKGNCTFAAVNNITYSTMGICSTCNDILDQVEARPLSNGTIYLSLPDAQKPPSIQLGGQGAWFSAQTVVHNSSTTFRGTINSTVLAFTQGGCHKKPRTTGKKASNDILCPHDGPGAKALEYLPPNLSIVAAECSLSPCLRNYHGKVKDGKLREDVVNTSAAYLEQETGYYRALKLPCSIKDTHDQSNVSRGPGAGLESRDDSELGPVYAPSDCIYRMNATIMLGLQKFLEGQLQGDCQNFPGVLYDPSQVECGDQEWRLDNLRHGGRATIASIRSDMNSLATAVTNRMRMMGGSGARGTSLEKTLCVDVHWSWLTLPACLIGASVGLLIAILLQSCRERGHQPVWKSSLLPFLFYGVRSASSDGAHDAAPAETHPDQLQQLRHLRKQANQTMVQLKNGENG